MDPTGGELLNVLTLSGLPVPLYLLPPEVVTSAEALVDGLVQQATSTLLISKPVLRFGPDKVAAVHRRTYLWVDDPGAISSTAAAGAVSVTATATISNVEWSMGEPVTLDSPRRLVAPFVCDGAGLHVDPGVSSREADPAVQGSCSYVFQWRSDTDRTGGTGKWPVTAVATWTVTWQSSLGTAGTLSLTSVGATPLEVVEWRAVLIPPPR